MEPDQLRLYGELYRLVRGYQVTPIVYVAAELGIADLLRDGAQSSAELAAATHTDASALARLLRALTALGLLHEGDDHRFSLTSLGECLREDSPLHGRAMVRWLGGENMWRTWGDQLHSVRTGQSAFSHIFIMSNVFDYYAKHPELEEIMSGGFAAQTLYFAAAITEVYDFSTFEKLADVGGGRGALLATILRANPQLHGILFDLPHVVLAAVGLLEQAGITNRCQAVSGDMFESVPAGADGYILSRVIHDWDDEKSIAILTSCRAAMRSGSRLLLIERVLPARATPSVENEVRFLGDINMLVRTGGRERTVDQYKALLSAAGLRLVRVIPTPTDISVVEAMP